MNDGGGTELAPRGTGLGRALQRFAADDEGGMSLEFVLWFPVFTLTLLAALDASFYFMTHAQMWNAARATARNMAVGSIDTQVEAQAYAMQFLPTHVSFTITTDFEHSAERMKLRIAGDTDDIGLFGIMSALSGRELVTQLVVRKEIPDGSSGEGAAI